MRPVVLNMSGRESTVCGVDQPRLLRIASSASGNGDSSFSQLIWKSQNDPAAYAAPAIAAPAGVRQLICFTVDGLIGLDLKDGGLLWRVPMKTM
jgi:hypothetical protein